MKMIAAAGAMAMATVAVPAMAQVTVYTTQASFTAQHPGYGLTNFDNATITSGRNAAVAGVTFSNPSALIYQAKGNTFFTGGPSFIYGFDTTTVTFGGSALGLLLGFGGAGTLTYTVNGGAARTLVESAAPATYFLGFDTGSTAPLSITFTDTSAVAFLGIISAVPEAATWATMMVGLGMVGGTLRRRRTVTTPVAFA